MVAAPDIGHPQIQGDPLEERGLVGGLGPGRHADGRVLLEVTIAPHEARQPTAPHVALTQQQLVRGTIGGSSRAVVWHYSRPPLNGSVTWEP